MFVTVLNAIRSWPAVTRWSISWIVGTMLGGQWLGFGPRYPSLVWPALICLCLGALTLLTQAGWRQISIALFGVVCGLLWFGLRGTWATPTDLSALVRQKANYVGTLVTTPVRRALGCDHVLDLKSIRIKEANFPALARVQIRLPECIGSAGDRFEAAGKLVLPRNSKQSDFDYVGYLARQRIHYQVEGGEPISVSTGGFSLGHQLLGLNQVWERRINRLWSEPQSSLLAGILLGARRGFDEATELAMSRTGTTHIVAISGYNITLIIVLLSSVLGQLFPRKALFIALSIGILLFVLFVGASASVVRAGWMGWLYLFARRLGRPAKVLSLLLLAVWIMFIWDPLQWWNLGFQLSVLATAGLILVYSPLEGWVIRRFGDYRKLTAEKLSGKVWHWIRLYLIETLLVTLAAQSLVLPLLITTFGEVSLLSPLANVAVLFAIPVAMATGFVTLLFSLVFGQLGSMLGFPFWLMTERLLWYKLQVIQGLSLLPLATLDLQHVATRGVWFLLAALLPWVAVQTIKRRHL